MGVPSWLEHAIFYQIFPDRFANGDASNDPLNVQAWGSKPDGRHFQGGDLAGIRQHIGYLQDLGVNAVYLNPIFLSPSNHRYNTVDYFRIDPKLGSNAEFKELLDDLHHNDIRLILDGVFNHSGRGFFAFNDILENEKDSPYLDWYHVKDFPLNAYTSGKAKNYIGWWDYKSLPKFNTNNPQVRRYLLDAARYWIDQGIDGWRLDVPNEIDDDEFWAEFRAVVKGANPEAYLVGELWEPDSRWVGDTHFDGLMNYPLRAAILELLTSQGGTERFVQTTRRILNTYPENHRKAMYLLLGSHDTVRIKTKLRRSRSKLKLALALLFSFPGVPAIYYGDEVGLTGLKDPGCRRAFPWNSEEWDLGLRKFIQKLIQVRKALGASSRVTIRTAAPEGQADILLLEHAERDSPWFAAFNLSGRRAEVRIPISPEGPGSREPVYELLHGAQTSVDRDGRLRVDLGAWQTGYYCMKPVRL